MIPSNKKDKVSCLICGVLSVSNNQLGVRLLGVLAPILGVVTYKGYFCHHNISQNPFVICLLKQTDGFFIPFKYRVLITDPSN